MNPTSTTRPPSVVQLSISGIFGSSAHDETKMCHGVYVAPRKVLTAAHCFGNLVFGQPVNSLRAGGVVFTYADVRFHPMAWADGNGGRETWETTRHNSGIVGEYDLAFVHLPSEPTGPPSIAKLYRPAGDDDSSFVSGHELNSALTFGGLNGTGSQTVFGRAQNNLNGGSLLKGDRFPSRLEEGDSGGGAFLTLRSGMPAPTPVGTQHCLSQLATPQVGDSVLVGINQAFHDQATVDFFVPTYLPYSYEWILKQLSADLDGDGVCEANDACPSLPDNQANCNAIAEKEPAWGSNGKVLGDACDPAPCPRPRSTVTNTVTLDGAFPDVSTTGDAIVMKFGARRIADRIDFDPVLKPGDPSMQSSVDPRFCQCVASDGTPLTDPKVCKDAPHNCKLDPRHVKYEEEVGGGAAPGPGQTYWRQMSNGSSVLPADAGPIPITYPGSAVGFTWDYKKDYSEWLAAGWVEPPPPSAELPPGTGLAGLLWGHDRTTVGAAAHGITQDPFDPAGIADGYAFIAADAEDEVVRAFRLPVHKPPPIWSFCPECGDRFRFVDESRVNPAPIVTIDDQTLDATAWTRAGGSDVTKKLSTSLRTMLASPGAKLVAASEPVATTNDHAYPRAVFVTEDGAQMFDWVTKRDDQFVLARADGYDLGGARNLSTARSGHGVAYSRTAGAVFVVGGRYTSNGMQAGVNARWLSGTLTSVSLASSVDASNIIAAAYSHRDKRLWVINQSSTGQRRLLRIEPLTGKVDTNTTFWSLDLVKDVWLVAREDGKIFYAGTSYPATPTFCQEIADLPQCFSPHPAIRDLCLASLGSCNLGTRTYWGTLDVDLYTPGAPVTLQYASSVDGKLATAPAIHFGRVTMAFEEPVSAGGTEVPLLQLVLRPLCGPRSITGEPCSSDQSLESTSYPESP